MDTIWQRAGRDWWSFVRAHWIGHIVLAVPSGALVGIFQGDESSLVVWSAVFGLGALALVLVASFPYFLAAAPYRILRHEADSTIKRLKGYEDWKKRVDATEWDWRRFKTAKAARVIVEQMDEVASQDNGPSFDPGRLSGELGDRSQMLQDMTRDLIALRDELGRSLDSGGEPSIELGGRIYDFAVRLRSIGLETTNTTKDVMGWAVYVTTLVPLAREGDWKMARETKFPTVSDMK